MCFLVDAGALEHENGLAERQRGWTSRLITLKPRGAQARQQSCRTAHCNVLPPLWSRCAPVLVDVHAAASQWAPIHEENLRWVCYCTMHDSCQMADARSGLERQAWALSISRLLGCLVRAWPDPAARYTKATFSLGQLLIIIIILIIMPIPHSKCIPALA